MEFKHNGFVYENHFKGPEEVLEDVYNKLLYDNPMGAYCVIEEYFTRQNVFQYIFSNVLNSYDHFLKNNTPSQPSSNPPPDQF